jgi:serpin B
MIQRGQTVTIRLFRSLFIINISVGIAACGGDPVGPIDGLPRNLDVAELSLIESDNRFALKLFREISAEQPGTNLFISPLSVAMALGMTYNGAGGETKAAMERTLELEGMTLQQINEAYRSLIDLLVDLDSKVQFDLANSIWYRQGVTVQPAFVDLNRTYFDAAVSAVDLTNPSSLQTINDWVKDNTQGKIDKIYDELPPNLVMLLLNAIYFKGDWTYEFDKSLTKDAPFTLPDGNEQTVKMMSQPGEGDFLHFSNDVVEIIDLPYGRQAFSMTVLLPHPGESIDALVAGIDDETWQSWTAGLSKMSVTVSMPRFTLEYEIRLNDVLDVLGMGVAFTGAADFSGIVPGGGIWIDEVKHKTFVDVNEEGTEAAAVTSVILLESASQEFRIDRPFVFVIRENFSGTIVFMGKIVDPEST